MGGKKYNYKLNSDRIIAMCDADCFAVQVYFKGTANYAHIWTEPLAVALKDGPIISANHIAMERNVRRLMPIDNALDVCPDITIYEIDQQYGMPTYMKLIEAKDAIIFATKQYFKSEKYNTYTRSVPIEVISSEDKFFIDLTSFVEWFAKNINHIRGHDYYNRELLEMNVTIEAGNSAFKLTNKNGMKNCRTKYAAAIISELYEHILEQTGYHVSFGISHNKLLAHISARLNKPMGITILKSKPGIARVFEMVTIRDVLDNFGEWRADHVKLALNVTTLKQLRAFRRLALRQTFDRSFGAYLWDIARGIDNRSVFNKLMPLTISTSRKYVNALRNVDDIRDAIADMCHRIYHRMRYDRKLNKRDATVITAMFHLFGGDIYQIPYSVEKNFGQFIDLMVKKIYERIVDEKGEDVRVFKITMIADFKAVNNNGIESLVNSMGQFNINA